MSPFFSRLVGFFPPVVTGSVITIIGLSLLPVAVRWAGGGNPAAADFGSIPTLLLSAFVLLLVIIFYRWFSGVWRNISVLLALVIGTVVASFCGYTDFSHIGKADWLGLVTPLHFGVPTFDIPAIIVMILVILVVMTETTGDIIAVGAIVGRPAKTITRGLRADGFSTLLGGILNTFPYTAFAQNIGLITLTNVKSRFVVAGSGVILMLLGLFPKMAALVACIPAPVLGGAGIAMFGMVAANGIRVLAKVEYEGEGNYNVLIVGISLAMGLLSMAVPEIFKHLTGIWSIIFHSGITIGSLTAIILNAILNRNNKLKK